MARLTLRHRLARVHPFVWIGAVAAAGALIAWPLGGWDTVELQSTKIPDAAPGTMVEALPFSIQVDSAEITTVHPDGFSEPEPGWEWLIVGLTVINTTNETQLSSTLYNNPFGSFTIDDGTLGVGSTLVGVNGYDVDPQQYLVADGDFLPDLQPGLTTALSLVWPVPDDYYDAGDTITVGVIDRDEVPSSLSTGVIYTNPVVIANVDIRVEQGAEAPPEDDEVSP